jgi:23S rRNA pseudouridine1911/1915/1917 synthase
MNTPTFKAGDKDTGRAVADFLSGHLRLTRMAVERLIRAKKVRVGGTVCLDPRAPLCGGQHVLVDLGSASYSEPGTKDGRPKPAIVIVHADPQIVVVNKPPGLTTMRHKHEAREFGKRGQRFLPDTLQDLLPDLLTSEKGKPYVRAVHRLDNETSGLIVFARTPPAESSLGRQFRAHSTERLYVALVRGRPRDGRVESMLVRDRGDGRRGSGAAEDGQRAATHVRVVEALGDYSLVECRLDTGRTHQVRIHLGEAGTPLCGERIYDRPLNGKPTPDESGARRVMLHAATLGFNHPATGERVRWEASLPKDMAELVKKVRRQKS